MKYIHTNKNNSEHLQAYEKAVWDVVKPFFSNSTLRFADIQDKEGATGFFCVNASECFKKREFVDLLPNFEDYTGLLETDDVSIWVAIASEDS